MPSFDLGLFYFIPLLYTLLQHSIVKKVTQSRKIYKNLPGITYIACWSVFLWILFHVLVVPHYGNFLLVKFYQVPYFIKCPIYHPSCERGDIDGWSFYHLLDHLIAGLLYPHVKIEIPFVLFQSLVCELGEVRPREGQRTAGRRAGAKRQLQL